MLVSLLWLLAAQTAAAPPPPAGATEAFDPSTLKPLAPGEGRAVIECKVQPDGHLKDCRVLHEEPVGRGFGETSVEAAAKFRMKPPHPAPNEPAPTVRIPLRWSLDAASERRGPITGSPSRP